MKNIYVSKSGKSAINMDFLTKKENKIFLYGVLAMFGIDLILIFIGILYSHGYRF